jgi:hypothetical protein
VGPDEADCAGAADDVTYDGVVGACALALAVVEATGAVVFRPGSAEQLVSTLIHTRARVAFVVFIESSGGAN